jgi:hypothetical protein
MLQAFVDLGSHHYMNIANAQLYDQRPFRSMLVQEWIAYRPGKGFHITKKGSAAWREFRGTEIWRKNPMQPLTSLFDPTVYGLQRGPVKIVQMPSQSAVA